MPSCRERNEEPERETEGVFCSERNQDAETGAVDDEVLEADSSELDGAHVADESLCDGEQGELKDGGKNSWPGDAPYQGTFSPYVPVKASPWGCTRSRH